MRAVQLAELARIFAEQMRPEFAQPGAHAVGVGRQIERPERTDLAVADQAGVGLDARRSVLSKTVTDLPPDHL